MYYWTVLENIHTIHAYHGPLPHFNPSPFPPCPQNSITVNPPLPSTPPI